MKPQFFCIILSPSLQLHQLRIPQAFIIEHGSSLLDHAFLETPGSESQHKVDLTIDEEGHTRFDNGWEVFASSYSLAFGYFLVFLYEGNSRFQVLIFDKSCSEIAYPDFRYTDDDDQGDSEDEIVDPLERARDFKSDNPNFIAPMSKSCLTGDYRMWVPIPFAKEYMKDEKTMNLRVEGDPNGEDWRVSIVSGMFRRGEGEQFSARLAWKRFAIDNGLLEGDVCVFEMIDNESESSEKTYKVHIFRRD